MCAGYRPPRLDRRSDTRRDRMHHADPARVGHLLIFEPPLLLVDQRGLPFVQVGGFLRLLERVHRAALVNAVLLAAPAALTRGLCDAFAMFEDRGSMAGVFHRITPPIGNRLLTSLFRSAGATATPSGSNGESQPV